MTTSPNLATDMMIHAALERCRDWAAQRRTDGSVVAAHSPGLPGRPRSGAA